MYVWCLALVTPRKRGESLSTRKQAEPEKRVSVESVKTALQELGVTLKYAPLHQIPGDIGSRYVGVLRRRHDRLRAALVNGVCSETGILQMEAGQR